MCVLFFWLSSCSFPSLLWYEGIQFGSVCLHDANTSTFCLFFLFLLFLSSSLKWFMRSLTLCRNFLSVCRFSLFVYFDVWWWFFFRRNFFHLEFIPTHNRPCHIYSFDSVCVHCSTNLLYGLIRITSHIKLQLVKHTNVRFMFGLCTFITWTIMVKLIDRTLVISISW